MPLFTPPTVEQGSSDHFFGRYSIPVGQSVVKKNGVYRTTPFPALAEIAGLKEGVDWFQGGRSYWVTEELATQLEVDGYTVDLPGYGSGAYGYGPFGG